MSFLSCLDVCRIWDEMKIRPQIWLQDMGRDENMEANKPFSFKLIAMCYGNNIVILRALPK